MLNFLRSKNTQKPIFIGLIVILISSFVVSLLLFNHEDRKTASEVGRIHGRAITVQDYLASYKAVDHQARIMYGQAFDQVRPYINFKGEAWDRLLLLSYAKGQGIRATDDEVIDWINQQPFLQNHGQFDERLYRMFVSQYLQEDARRFEEEVRQMLTIGKIQDRIESSLRPSDAEVKELYARRFAEREIQYVVFQAPASGDTVPDEDLKKIYPLYEKTLREPAKAKIRYVFIPKEKEAGSKAALADNGAVAAIAQKYGLTVTESPFFSPNESIPGLGLAAEVIEKSFSLKPGETSAWISTPSGFCKIELVEKQPSKALGFDDGKEQLKKIYLHQKSVEESLRGLENLSKDLKPADFEKFAADHKLELKSMTFKPGAYIQGIGPSQSVEKALAQLKEGEISAPIPVPTGAALIKALKTSGVDEKKYAEQKEAFRKQVLHDKSQEAMDKLLDDLRKDLTPNFEALKQIFPEEEKR